MTYTLPNNHLLVLLPEGAKPHDERNSPLTGEFWYKEPLPNPGHYLNKYVRLPDGVWQLIGSIKDVTEEQARAEAECPHPYLDCSLRPGGFGCSNCGKILMTDEELSQPAPIKEGDKEAADNVKDESEERLFTSEDIYNYPEWHFKKDIFNYKSYDDRMKRNTLNRYLESLNK